MLEAVGSVRAVEMPADALRSQFQKLTFAPFILAQMAIPGMRREPGGMIINVTSLAGRLPLPYSAAYSAAKAALSVLTATLQMEEHEAGGTPSASWTCSRATSTRISIEQ